MLSISCYCKLRRNTSKDEEHPTCHEDSFIKSANEGSTEGNPTYLKKNGRFNFWQMGLLPPSVAWLMLVGSVFHS